MSEENKELDPVLEKVKGAAKEATLKEIDAHKKEFGESLKGVTAGFEEIKATVKSVDEKIIALDDKVKAVASKQAISIEGLGLSPKDKKVAAAITLGKMIAAISSNRVEGEIKELLDETRSKAMTAGSGVDGGYFIPVEQAAEFIPMLYDQFDIANMGITSYNPTSPEFQIRKGKTATSVGWIGEAEETPVGQPTLGMITMRPKLLAGRIIVSRRMADAGSAAFAQYLMTEIMGAMAEALSYAAFSGSGTDYVPLGLLKQVPAIPTLAVGATGDDPTGKFLQKLVGKVEDSKALRSNGRGGFVAHPSIIRKIKQYNSPQFSGDTQGMPILDPFMSNQALAARIGHDVVGTTMLTNGKNKSSGTNLGDLIFGNWADFILCKWGSMMIETTREGGTAWANHEMQIKVTTECDFAVKRKEAFAIAPYTMSDLS
jgi:HK97 family phage major capsid protein